MKRINIIIGILAILYISKMSASCGYAPKTFMENIRADHIIFLGTVLEHIETPKNSNYILLCKSLTKIKVDRWYQNRMKSDTIYYSNGNGNIFESIANFKGKDQLIIKAVRKHFYDPSEGYFLNPSTETLQFIADYRNKPTIEYTLCDESVLRVNDQMVIGNITKNYLHRKWKRIAFFKNISVKWADKLRSKSNRKKSKYQKWNLDRFRRFMIMKWHSL